MNGVESHDEGLDVGYRWYDATGQRPLFPFGYGLSYESFRVSDAHAAYDPSLGDAFTLARVTNTSSHSGPATVELFLQSPPAAQEPPKQLKGYSNVMRSEPANNPSDYVEKVRERRPPWPPLSFSSAVSSSVGRGARPALSTAVQGAR